jgi:subtilisin family serine protease
MAKFSPSRGHQTLTIPEDWQILGTADDAPEFWHLPRSVWQPIQNRVTGSGVIVAVIDTGATPHVLQGRGILYSSHPHRQADDDRNGHGTHVAGLVCSDPRISPATATELVIFNPLNERGEGDSDEIAKAIEEAVRFCDADIINLSLGGAYSQSVETAVQEAAAQGVLVVAAAGNDGYRVGRNTLGHPGSSSAVICVGAHDRQGRVSEFSSAGKEIDVACPGSEIVSLSNDGRGLTTMSGTSMAAPLFTSAACLVLELLRRSGGRQAKQLRWWQDFLAANSQDIGTPGHDVRSGHGIPMWSKIVEVLSNEDYRWA